MGIKAILMVGGRETPFAERPTALLDVLGRPLLHRLVDELCEQLSAEVTVVLEPGVLDEPLPLGVKVIEAQEEMQARAAEQAFELLSEETPAAILLVRLGAYAEIDWRSMVQCYAQRHARVLRAYHGEEPLDIFCLSPMRRNEAAFILRNDLQRTRSESLRFHVYGYVNRLDTPHSLRQLAIDGLHQRCNLQPIGTELRPGIWVAENARIEKGARLVAPVFIGRRAKVRSGAVVTRSSAVEHHSVIDCGTVVENATVLPYSVLGPGLDVSHSIVGAKQVFHLKRNAQVLIGDPKLLDELSPNSGVRLLAGVAGLLGLLPKLAYEGVRSASSDGQPTLDAVTAASSSNYGATNIYEKDQTRDGVTEFPGALA
jgi:hypothetical protein